MGLCIDVPTMTSKEAVEFAQEHVVIALEDIERVSALARSLGFEPQLRALDVIVYPLAVTSDKPLTRQMG